MSKYKRVYENTGPLLTKITIVIDFTYIFIRNKEKGIIFYSIISSGLYPQGT